ncbi:hypothetical protein, partial [Microcella sp.]|uniref:hypothetical protein n=1 Tax=Microcella sp. TaxID=1913979 RepID=UPI00299F53D5
VTVSSSDYLFVTFVTVSEFCERPLEAFLSAFATRFSFSDFAAAVFGVFLRADFSPMGLSFSWGASEGPQVEGTPWARLDAEAVNPELG